MTLPALWLALMEANYQHRIVTHTERFSNGLVSVDEYVANLCVSSSPSSRSGFVDGAAGY